MRAFAVRYTGGMVASVTGGASAGEPAKAGAIGFA
jgi:hypothetical protein